MPKFLQCHRQPIALRRHFAYHLAFGLKKNMPFKNAIWLAYQNPRALISSLSSLPATVECWRYSPVNWWSCGSTRTSLKTSFNSIDVMVLMWMCRKETKSLFLHERACWISNLMPHSQLNGKLASVQPYMIRIKLLFLDLFFFFFWNTSNNFPQSFKDGRSYFYVAKASIFYQLKEI